MMNMFWRTAILCAILQALSACSGSLTSSLLRPTLANLQKQTDIDLVCEGTPSFLLMIDSMVASSPDDKKLLMTATQAFTGYAAALDACKRPERAAIISNKARTYGVSLLKDDDAPESIYNLPLADLQELLGSYDSGDVDQLFWAGNGWTTWIRHQKGSPESLAQLVKVEQIMLRVLELDESYYHGGGHLFIGAYLGSKPPLFGGKPEQSKQHFEQALTISNRQFLPALVLYAQTYARMTFDRELYIDLLQEVLDFKLESQPNMHLANVVAKRQASSMLEQVEQFF